MQCYELNVWGTRRLPNNCVRPRTRRVGRHKRRQTNGRKNSNGNTDPSWVGGWDPGHPGEVENS